jgi:hypothetical protein
MDGFDDIPLVSIDFTPSEVKEPSVKKKKEKSDEEPPVAADEPEEEDSEGLLCEDPWAGFDS